MNTTAIGLTFTGKARTAGYNNQHHNHQVAGGSFNKAQFNKNKAAMNMPHNRVYSQTDTFHRAAPGTVKNGNGTNSHVVVEHTLPAQVFTKEAIAGISDYIGGTASTGKPIDPTILERFIAFLTALFVALTGTLPNPNAQQIKQMTGTILNPPAIYEGYTPPEDDIIDVTPDDEIPDDTTKPGKPVVPPEDTTPVVPPDDGGNDDYPVGPTPGDDTTDPPTTDPVDPPVTEDPADDKDVDPLPDDIVVKPQDPDPVDPDDIPGSTLPDPDDNPIVGGDDTTTPDPDGPKIEVDTDDDFSGNDVDDPSQGGVDTPPVTEPEETEPEEPVTPPVTEPEDTTPVTPPVTEPEETEPEEPVTPPVTEPEDTTPVTPPATEPEETEPEEPVTPPIIRDEEDEF